MKILRWLVAILAVLSFAVVAGPAFAQTEAIDKMTLKLQKDPGNGDLRSNLVVMIYRQGLEDLRNNFAPDAVTTLENGLEVAQEGPKPMADSSPAVKDMRYALGYAFSQQGRYFDAVPVLDDLVASAPELISARYLLGVTLIRSNSNENILRGMEVLAQMAAEGSLEKPHSPEFARFRNPARQPRLRLVARVTALDLSVVALPDCVVPHSSANHSYTMACDERGFVWRIRFSRPFPFSQIVKEPSAFRAQHLRAGRAHLYNLPGARWNCDRTPIRRRVGQDPPVIPGLQNGGSRPTLQTLAAPTTIPPLHDSRIPLHAFSGDPQGSAGEMWIAEFGLRIEESEPGAPATGHSISDFGIRIAENKKCVTQVS